MKTIIKTTFTYCIVLFAFQFCAKESRIDLPVESDLLQADLINQNVYYNEATDSFFRYQEDPYSVSNFQKAYSILLKQKKELETKGLNKEQLDAIDLSATDYALRLYPKSIKEQSEIETMEDIEVSYYPFNYTVINTPQGSTLQYESIEFDKNPYTEIVKDVYSSAGDYIESQEISLPVLYVVWPKNKPIPEKYDYTIDYEVLIPSHVIRTRSENNNDYIKLIEKQAIDLVFNRDKLTTRSLLEVDPDSLYYRDIAGAFTVYDNIKQANVGLENLQFRFQLGTNIITGYSVSGGNYYLSIEVPDYSTFSCSFQSSEWKITSSGSTTPIGIYLGTIPDIMGNNPNYNHNLNFTLTHTSPVLHIHRAVNYLYNGSHDIGVHTLSSPLWIQSSVNSNSNNSGETHSSSNSDPWIIIYNNNQSDHGVLLNTVFHELGHVMHHEACGGFSYYSNATKFIQESYATYTGWHGCCRYYNSIGYNSTFYLLAMQYWTPNISNPEYSPLFIDLVDTYNQNNSSSSYLKDNISGVPASVINQIISSCNNFAACKSVLESYIGQYYTSAYYYTYIVGYGIPYNF